MDAATLVVVIKSEGKSSNVKLLKVGGVAPAAGSADPAKTKFGKVSFTPVPPFATEMNSPILAFVMAASAIFAPVTAPSAIFAVVTALVANLTSVTAPSASLAVVTFASKIFTVVTALD